MSLLCAQTFFSLLASRSSCVWGLTEVTRPCSIPLCRYNVPNFTANMYTHQIQAILAYFLRKPQYCTSTYLEAVEPVVALSLKQWLQLASQDRLTYSKRWDSMKLSDRRHETIHVLRCIMQLLETRRIIMCIYEPVDRHQCDTSSKARMRLRMGCFPGFDCILLERSC